MLSDEEVSISSLILFHCWANTGVLHHSSINTSFCNNPPIYIVLLVFFLSLTLSVTSIHLFVGSCGKSYWGNDSYKKMKWQKNVVTFINKFPHPSCHMAPQVFVSIRLKGIVEAGSVYSSIHARNHIHQTTPLLVNL